MRDAIAIGLLSLAIVGGLLLGGGITGMVAHSQSCCAGEACALALRCAAAGDAPSVAPPAMEPWGGVGLGVALLAVVVGLLLAHRHNREPA